MKGISFKQYLILRKLHKIKPDKMQLEPESQDFIYLVENNLIKSEKNIETKSVAGFPMIYSHNNGLSSIANDGIDLYHSYNDIKY